MISNLFIRHAAVIFLAFFVGALTVAPQIMVEHRLGAVYQGVHKEMSDDEGYYVARAQEVLDGHPTNGNTYLFEEKAEPPLQVWVPEAVLAWIGASLFPNTRIMWLAWDFLFPALIVVVTYAIGLIITHRRLMSVGFASLLSMGIYLETFNRSPSPQVNFVFFLLFLYALFLVIETRSRRAVLAATTLLGALFYIYTYYWTYVVVLLALTGAGAFVWFRETHLHRLCAAILAGGFVIGIPYFVSLRAAQTLPYYSESLARVGLIVTHSPSGIFIVGMSGVVTIAYALAWWRRMIVFSPLSMTLLAGSLSGAIAVNQHLITGINLEFSSHYYLVAMYADFFAFFYLFAEYSKRVPRYREILLKTALALVLAYSLIQAGRVVHKQLELTSTFVQNQRYAPVLQWLQDHTRTDDVIYADPVLSFLTPEYTHDNVFYAQAAMLYIMPQSKVRNRFLLEHYFGVLFTRTDFSAGLELEREIYGNFYIEEAAHGASLNTLRRLVGLPALAIERYPEADIASLIKEERALRMKPFLEQIAPYRVDYLVWDRALHPDWHIDRVAGLTKVGDVGDFAIYKTERRS